jgi:hypothetical protein
LWKGDGDGTPEQARRREQAGGLDRLGGEGEAVDRLRVGVQDRQARGNRQCVAGEQAGEREGGDREGCWIPGPPRQSDDQPDERDGRGNEPEAGTRAFVEVPGYERAVDAGADGAGEDDDVSSQAGEAHLTITSPSMSLLCSVQT